MKQAPSSKEMLKSQKNNVQKNSSKIEIKISDKRNLTKDVKDSVKSGDSRVEVVSAGAVSHDYFNAKSLTTIWQSEVEKLPKRLESAPV